MDIAVLGMGRMGQAAAQRLLHSGHQVTIWNRTPGKAAAVVAGGATEAATVSEAVGAAEVVITVLSNDEAVRQVALGAGGVAESMADDAVYVDSSTVSPDLSRELADRIGRFVAMPILGPPHAVAAGSATYLLGGDAATVAAVEPVVRSLSDSSRRYDTAPLASTAKLASNLLLLDAVVALSESFAVGRAGGLSDDQLRELLVSSPMVAPGLANRFEGVLLGGQEPWWSAELGAKDASLAIALAASAGRGLPATTAARDQYLEVARSGAAGADIASVTDLYRGG